MTKTFPAWDNQVTARESPGMPPSPCQVPDTDTSGIWLVSRQQWVPRQEYPLTVSPIFSPSQKVS